ncbi:MAG: GWxTD domain-containing protein [Candidatus Edwardsbacteria bacterium]
MKYFIITLLIVLSDFASGSEGFPLISTGEIKFYLDGAQFRGENEKTQQEIYYKIPFDQFNFVPEGENLKTIYRTTVTLTDSLGKSLLNQNWQSTSYLKSLEDAQQRDLSIIDQIEMPLFLGSYKFSLKIEDVNSNKSGIVTQDLKVSSYLQADTLFLSDIELASQVQEDTTAGKFVKNGLRILPNPPHLFGKRFGILYCYLEIYNLKLGEGTSPGTYEVKYSIVNDSNEVARSLPATTKSKPGKNVVEVGGINILGLSSGKYRVRVEVFDNQSEQKATKEISFEVVRFTTATSTKRESEEQLKQLYEKKGGEYYEQIELLATAKEMDTFSKLEPQGKKEFLYQFWRKRDLKPETPENEFLIEYVERFRYVELHFSTKKQKGSETDRGRIYIKYGAPDEIDRHPADPSYKSFEIWRYSGGGGREFAFADVGGFGKYQLVYSSVREELTDPNWSRWVDPQCIQTGNR